MRWTAPSVVESSIHMPEGVARRWQKRSERSWKEPEGACVMAGPHVRSGQRSAQVSRVEDGAGREVSPREGRWWGRRHSSRRSQKESEGVRRSRKESEGVSGSQKAVEPPTLLSSDTWG